MIELKDAHNYQNPEAWKGSRPAGWVEPNKVTVLETKEFIPKWCSVCNLTYFSEFCPCGKIK